MSSLTLLAASLTSAFFAAVWQGVLLAAVSALCLRLIPALTAAARFLVWLTVAVLTLLLPFVQTSAPYALGSHAFPRTLSLSLDSRWTVFVAAVWAVASLVRAVQLATGAVTLYRLARAATPIAAPEICAALLAKSRRAESHPVQLCSSTHVDRPSVLGFFHPRILLPAGLIATLTPEELYQVLLHELEHLRRRDDWTNLLGRLALVIFPLNPVLLWLERRLATERELACDDRVLEATGARKSYAAFLAHLAEHTLLRRGVSLALSLVGISAAPLNGLKPSRSELGRRVTRILGFPTRTLNPRISAALVTGLIVLTTGGSVELAHSPQLIQFTSPEAQFAATTNSHTDAQFLPVAYHSPTNISPLVMTKAVLTTRRTVQSTLLKTTSNPQQRNKSSFRTGIHRGTSPLTPYVRLTTFHTYASDTHASNGLLHLTLSVATANQFSYAAVPVHGGWVLVLLPVQTVQPALTLNL